MWVKKFQHCGVKCYLNYADKFAKINFWLNTIIVLQELLISSDKKGEIIALLIIFHDTLLLLLLHLKLYILVL